MIGNIKDDSVLVVYHFFHCQFYLTMYLSPLVKQIHERGIYVHLNGNAKQDVTNRIKCRFARSRTAALPQYLTA